MTSAASLVHGQVARGATGHAGRARAALLKRRTGQRRRILGLQVVNCFLIALVLLVHAYAGLVPMLIPAAYLLGSIGLIGIFLALSESHVNERFDDHYLTVFQVGCHVALQFVFMLAAPQIGYAFLNVVFVIFGFGALRMTSRQATIAWTLTTLGLAPILVLTGAHVGSPLASGIERVAAMLSYALTIGQCAFAGLYGSSLRKMLHDRGSELKAAYRRIEELAELDELTGCFNRRCIMRALEEEMARAQRLNNPCSVALIDLDWFKRVNDAYGHPTGDEVLRTFAITMFANIRSTDKFGRYGGEEFLLVLPDTAADDAVGMLDRLRAIVSELDWSAFSSGMRVTISAGLATLRPDEASDTLLARADRALYASKAHGRNRITSS
jgi:diguanylate cyclase (GGDEF)-like protein